MRIKRGYKIRHIAGESVVEAAGAFSIDLPRVVSLNPTSAWLWDQLGESDFTEQKVAELLVENYDVEPRRALRDSRNWIESLEKAGLIEK